MIRKLWPRLSSHAVKPAEQAGTLRAVRHAHAAGDVCWGFFSREELSSVIDGGG